MFKYLKYFYILFCILPCKSALLIFLLTFKGLMNVTVLHGILNTFRHRIFAKAISATK